LIKKKKKKKENEKKKKKKRKKKRGGGGGGGFVDSVAVPTLFAINCRNLNRITQACCKHLKTVYGSYRAVYLGTYRIT